MIIKQTLCNIIQLFVVKQFQVKGHTFIPRFLPAAIVKFSEITWLRFPVGLKADLEAENPPMRNKNFHIHDVLANKDEQQYIWANQSPDSWGLVCRKGPSLVNPAPLFPESSIIVMLRYTMLSKRGMQSHLEIKDISQLFGFSHKCHICTMHSFKVLILGCIEQLYSTYLKKKKKIFLKFARQGEF